MFCAHVRTGSYSGCTVVELQGDLDLATGWELTELLATIAAGQQVTIIDLAALEFLDCGGLRSLVQARDQGRRDGHALLLAAAGAQVRQVLDLTRAARLFSIYDSVAVAAGHGRQLLVGG